MKMNFQSIYNVPNSHNTPGLFGVDAPAAALVRAGRQMRMQAAAGGVGWAVSYHLFGISPKSCSAKL
jgi:hypothetical protein